jgi:hypothetical protein
MPSHTPNANQLAQLATLKAAAAAASATLTSAQSALATAQTAYRTAEEMVAKYQAWVYGNGPYPGAIDVGSPETV